jgi:hypothetical protein
LIEEVDRRPHRTEPTAEEIAKDHHEKENSKGWKHPQNDIFLGKNRDDPDEGIEAKVKIYRNLQFEGESGM